MSSHSFYPDNVQLSSRAHFALSQLDADLSHPTRGPAILNQPKANYVGDFVDGLIAKSQHEWNALISNNFCAAMGRNELPQGDDHFRWYMVQDMIYLKNYVYYELGFFSRAPWEEIQIRMAGERIQKDIGYVNDQSNACVGLGVPRDKVLTAVASDIIKKYGDYMIEATQGDKLDWFSLHIMMLPCFLSYPLIAQQVSQDPKVKKETVFYKTWVSPLLEGSGHTAGVYRKFLNDNVPSHTEQQYLAWLELFKKSIKMEADFWAASMTGTIPKGGK